MRQIQRLISPSQAFAVVLLCAGCTFVLCAQTPTGSQTQKSLRSETRVSIVPRVGRPDVKSRFGSISVDSKLVLVPVTVTDPAGKPIVGLSTEAFQIFEDGSEQRITHFSHEDTPVSVGIIFDSSGSMEGKLDKSREALSRLFVASNPGDEYFLVAFSDRPKLLAGFTPDSSEIQSSLLSIQPKGWTSLHDAIYLSVNHMKRASNARKALLVLSDGGDNNSRFSHREIKSLLRETDICLYAVGILGPRVTSGSMKSLAELAEETGGRMFPVGNVNQVPEAIAKITIALHDQYVLGYTPNNSENDGKYRKVKVKVVAPPDSPPLHTSWRPGYYAPF